MQILVLEVQRQAESFALQGGEQGLADIEVHCVTELILTGRSTRLDSGRKLSGVVGSEARAAETSKQILESFESEEIDRFVRYVKLDVPLAVSLAISLALLVLRVYVTVLGQLLNQSINQPFHLFGRHVLQLLLHCLPHLLIKHVAVPKRL